MLLPRIEKFLRVTGMPWTKFGRVVAHDPRLVSDLRNGRQPRAQLARRIEAFLADHAPLSQGESRHAR